MRANRLPDDYMGAQFSPEVKNVIRLTLAFAKAAAAHQEDKEDNLVLSPYNAIAALAMAAKGADSETREEMAQTLFGKPANDLDAEADSYAALNRQILDANAGQVELKTANGVWTNKSLLTLRQDFADGLKQTFDAAISGEDFTDPDTVKKINQWAADNTNNLINGIVQELKAEDFAVLASALYFKGEWTNPFDKELTEDKEFTANGTMSLTPTMHQDFRKEGKLVYQQGDDYEAVSLTYGEQDYREGKYPTMRMIMVRPTDESVSAHEWLSAQDNGKFPAWLEPAAYEGAIGSIELPRLDIKQKHDLIPVLKELGIEAAFDDERADFSPMIEEDETIFINKVSHDVVFKTDEKGSEAAAVTTVGMVMATSVRPQPARIDVKFDRSFVFALQDVESGAVLFVGAVNKPNDDMKPAAPKAPGLG